MRRRRRNLRGMRRDLELWAIQITTIANWRERSTWFNVRVRDLERQLQALKREAPDVIEDRPPATLGDVRHTLGAMLATMKSIENHLAAMVEMRQRLSHDAQAVAQPHIKPTRLRISPATVNSIQ